jgi:cytochrome P450
MTAAPPPRLRPRWPGAYATLLARSPLEFVQQTTAAARAMGAPMVRVPVAGRTIVALADPELMREALVTQHRHFGRGFAHQGLRLFLGDGLLTSEDPLHRAQRRVIQPAFHRERVAAYARAMAAAAAAWDRDWTARARPAAGGAAELAADAAAEMNALTLGIAGETLFGARVAGAAAEVAGAVTAALGVAPLAFLPFGRLALGLPLPATRRFRAARASVDRVVLGMIADRRRARAAGADDQPDDLLAMLLDAADPDPGAEGGPAAPMSDAQLRDEVVTLFLAGHETTASALAWTWHLLAAHPAEQAALHAELDAVLTGADGQPRAPAFDDLPRLVRTRAVLSEAMRLYPPAYAIGRLCVAPTTLGGYGIARGWGVLTSPWVAHHDAAAWPEPEAFRPARWLDDDASARTRRAAYFPFGAGPRICIGEQFAWTEMTLVLALLARRWAVRAGAGPAVRLRGAVTLRPADGVPAVFTARVGPAGVQAGAA